MADQHLLRTGERHQTCSFFQDAARYTTARSHRLPESADLGAAIRICQQLGLHKLGHDPANMPSEDVALPPGINSLRREIPIRLFQTLLYLDYMMLKVKTSLPPHLGA